MKHDFKILLFLSLSVLAGVGVYQGLHPGKTARVPLQEKPTEEGIPLLGGPFSLYDQNGKKRTNSDFLGKWMLIYFGYTFCPDICPTGLSAMSSAVDQVDPQGEKIVPIFITIDPTRDTIENLKIYSENFHPHFIMLTGPLEGVQQTMKAYRVYGAKVHPDGASDYIMDHSSLIYLMDPEGKYKAHFSHQTPAEEMVEKMKNSCGF